MLYSEINELFQVNCPNCRVSWQADCNFQLIAGGRIYTCKLCQEQFEVTIAMFEQARNDRKVTGIPLRQKAGPGSRSENAPMLADGQNPLLADAKRRAEEARA